MSEPSRENLRFDRLMEERGWKRTEVAAMVNAAYEVITGKEGCYDADKIRQIARGTLMWPTKGYRLALEKAFGVTATELGLYNPRAATAKPSQTGTSVHADLLLGWGGEEVDEVQRRELLRAIAVLTASSPAIVAALNADELERTIRAAASPNRVDGAVLDNVQAILNAARLQDDLLGPQAAIRTTLTQVDITEALLRGYEGSLASRLMSLRSKVSTSAGWQLFDLGRKESAVDHFEKARDVADEARDYAASAMALAEWSGMTEEVGRPIEAADQAAAAEFRAARTGDPHLQAHAAGISALALAKSGPEYHADARAALARADSFDVSTTRTPDESLAYFCTPGHIARMRAKALRQIGDLPAAIDAARESLRLQAVRDRAASHILLGTIYVDAGQLDAGIESISTGAEVDADNGSARLSGQLLDARNLVHVRAPGSTSARRLDARLTQLQIV
ncbi:M48 family metallopeptidase [Nocardia sp. CC227C]|uniref:tetratricopeptide repeat protein n=1 Tax=Nocardia sp. CC227C TaxID=3044562 RepID=UPI00278BB29F|nr:hypothetical protein [Nocardia sp. CC227C]